MLSNTHGKTVVSEKKCVSSFNRLRMMIIISKTVIVMQEWNFSNLQNQEKMLLRVVQPAIFKCLNGNDLGAKELDDEQVKTKRFSTASVSLLTVVVKWRQKELLYCIMTGSITVIPYAENNEDF